MNTDLFQERVRAAFDLYFGRLVGYLPTALAAILLLLVGYGIAKLFQYITRRVVRSIGLERMAEKHGMERVLSRLGGTAYVLGKLIYWLTLLFFMLAAAELLEIQLVSDAMRNMFAYVPRLLTATCVFVFGLWLAQKVRSVANGLSGSMGLSGGRVLGQLFFGIIVLFMSITALNVAQIDTTLITSNILILLGGILVAFSVAYGMASKDILTNILSSYYGKDRFEPGQIVRIGEDEGVIERIDSISMTIRTKDRTVMIPTSKLITERIELLDAQEEQVLQERA